jgi:phasin family protein
MYATPEQFSAASKAGFESFLALANTSFVGFEKLVELNIATSKAMLEGSSDAALSVMSAKDPKELIAISSSLAQPSVEKAVAYSKEVSGIFNDTQLAVRKAVEEQSTLVQKEFASALDKALKSAPAGSESAVAAIKSAVAASTSAYENASKIAKQAMDMAEAQFASAAATATQNVKAATKAPAKRR